MISTEYIIRLRNGEWGMDKKQLLRNLPKIDELLKEEIVNKYLESNSRALVVDSIRQSIDYYRNEILKSAIENFTKENVINYFEDILEENKSTKFKKLLMLQVW